MTNLLTGMIVSESTHVARLIAAALLNLHLQLKTAASEVCDHMIGIQHHDVMRQVEVGRRHNGIALLAENQRNFLTAFKLEDHALQIEEDVDGIFHHAFNLGVFVHDTRDLSLGRGIAHHGGEENAAERIAQGVTIAALERFERDHGTVRILLIKRDINVVRLEQFCIKHKSTFLFNTLGSLHR